MKSNILVPLRMALHFLTCCSLMLFFFGCYQSQTVSISLEKRALEGDPQAQLELGLKYIHGKGKATNLVDGFAYIQKAADQGLPEAQDMIGRQYSTGLGVPTNWVKAALWFRKAADQGFPEAQFRLGNRYHNGQGVSQSFAEATQWMLRAAKQGHKEAQWTLATWFYNGEAGRIDYREAYRWAAIQGTPALIKRMGHKLTQNDKATLNKEIDLFQPVHELKTDIVPNRHIMEWSLGAVVIILYAAAGWMWWRHSAQKKAFFQKADHVD